MLKEEADELLYSLRDIISFKLKHNPNIKELKTTILPHLEQVARSLKTKEFIKELKNKYY